MTTVSAPKRILIAERDGALRSALAEQFAQNPEFDATLAATIDEALAHLQQVQIDLVLLDVYLAAMASPEICKLLRDRGFTGPILLMTAQDGGPELMLGLESGANDYVIKPFRFHVLHARIRAQFQTASQFEPKVFELGPFLFKPSAKTLETDNGHTTRLTEKEAAILSYLMRAGGRVVARDELLHEVWGYQAGVSTHTLETHVYRLRQKMERGSKNAEILVTESGGYKLIP